MPLIRYNRCAGQIPVNSGEESEKQTMAKSKAKAKSGSAFMKPMRPSEHLAKIVGEEPLPRKEHVKPKVHIVTSRRYRQDFAARLQDPIHFFDQSRRRFGVPRHAADARHVDRCALQG